MTSQERVRTAVQAVIREMMDRVLVKVLEEDPFDKDQHHRQKPLYAALVPDAIFKGAHFERRFVTPFGHVWEKLAEVVATELRGVAQLGRVFEGGVPADRLRRIQEILDKLEHGTDERGRRVKPDWDNEIAYVLAGGGEATPATVIADLYVEDTVGGSGERWAFEIKAPMPNSDQTKVSKEKILKLLAMEPSPVNEAFFALPYNPYGRRDQYAWSFPGRWFDMQQDRVVLIGDEFWAKLGGEGTFEAIIEAVTDIGEGYKDTINRDYL